MPATKPTRSTLKKEDEVDVQVVRPEPLKVLLEWEAPTRAFKKRDREFFSTLGAIVFLVIVILLFLREWFFIGAIIALSFLVYILSTIPPEKTKHKVTNQGIITGKINYQWDVLSRFWFKEKWGQKILHVETWLRFPGRLMMLLGEKKEEEVKRILSDYLPEEEPEKTWVDKASEWLARAIPLEKSS